MYENNFFTIVNLQNNYCAKLQINLENKKYQTINRKENVVLFDARKIKLRFRKITLRFIQLKRRVIFSNQILSIDSLFLGP